MMSTRATTNGYRRHGKKQTVFGTAIIFFCVVSILDLDNYLSSQGTKRRNLLSNLYLQATHSTLLPWAHHHLVGVSERPTADETVLFWHIPKSGGTTVKRLYQCMGQTLAHRVGADPRFGHDQEEKIVVFEPHEGKDWKVVNVDTTIKAGILRAKRLGLVQSKTTDLIFTMEPNFAGQHLYDEDNKGRILSLFRHPVDRAVSMFYYLQTATWERTYRPEWANMTLLEWASLPNGEEDYMVHKLVGKSFGDHVDESDLIIAKELVRQRFMVGLMNEMEESIRRFNIALGVDENTERNHQCMMEFFAPKIEVGPISDSIIDGETSEKTKASDKSNSNKHPKVEEFSPEWEIIAGKNSLDMLLYGYVVKLFEEQKDIINTYLIEAPEDITEKEALSTYEINQEGFSLIQKPNSKSAVIPASIQHNVANVDDPVQGRQLETPFFWHVPKSGGTTLQRLYWCMGLTLANEVGGNPKFEYSDRNDIVSFRPWDDNPGHVVNVDVSTPKGIIAAKSRGFLSSADDTTQPQVDLISTSEFRFASALLYSPTHKARMFALFRHPVERAVSKFYYLQKASWEPTYNTRWKSMSLEEWASRDRGENNWMVRHLINKDPRSTLDTNDLEFAKEIIRTKFLVGMMDKFEESVHRFNIYLGINEGDATNQKCIDEFTLNGGSKKIQQQGKKNEWNSYSHPKAQKGSPAWKSLSKINSLDVLLYRFIREQFEEQRVLFKPTSAN